MPGGWAEKEREKKRGERESRSTLRLGYQLKGAHRSAGVKIGVQRRANPLEAKSIEGRLMIKGKRGKLGKVYWFSNLILLKPFV